MTIRDAGPGDLPAILAVQAESPEAAQWDAAGYLTWPCRVALIGDRVVGFLVTRPAAAGEREILNLAVGKASRRRGVARALLQAELAGTNGTWFLEVRESNQAARKLYLRMGFREAGRRAGYYHHPDEAAVVLSFRS